MSASGRHGRRKEAANTMKKRTESQPALESRRLPSLASRSTSQPPDASLRKAAKGDEVFSIMVMRQLQLRKDLAGQAQQLASSLPRLNSKTGPDSQSQQEQAAALIASMADAMMKRSHARQTNHREERRGDGDHWPSLVQQAAAAANFAAQAEVGGSSPLDRRGLSKTSLGSVEAHLSPFETMVMERRRAREAKAAAEAKRKQQHDREQTKEEETRPETPSHPCPFKEQPPPPPMPPDWSEWAWEKKKTELAAERLRRQHLEEEARAAPTPPPRATVPPGTVPSPTEELPHAWRPWRCPIFPWQQKAEERRAQERRPTKPPKPPSTEPGKGEPGPSDAGAGFGRAWNWGTGIFSGHSKVGALSSEELQQQEVDLVAARTKELIALLDAEMSSTKDRPMEARRRVFKDLQRRFHPDKNPAEEQAATLAFQHLMASRQGYLKA